MCGASYSLVVLANAGTHTHRTKFYERRLPRLLHPRTPVVMGPGGRQDEERGSAAGGVIRSTFLTIFWHCDSASFSFRTAAGCVPATNRQRFWPRIARSQGLVMLIGSEKIGFREGAAQAVRPRAPVAAPRPTLLIGGPLRLSCPPRPARRVAPRRSGDGSKPTHP